MNSLTIQEKALDSREVAEMTGKRHDHLVRDIRGYVRILRDSTVPKFGVSDFFIESTYEDSTGRTLPCYQITKQGCEMIANKLTGKKGVLFTAAYVRKFNQMESRVQAALPDFTNPAVAARAWADEYEGRILAEAKVTEMAPKAEYYDDLVDLDSCAGFRNTAKELKIPERKFISLLLKHKYIFKDYNGVLRPYAQYVGKWFQVKDYRNPRNGHYGQQTVITTEGKSRFRQLFAV